MKEFRIRETMSILEDMEKKTNELFIILKAMISNMHEIHQWDNVQELINIKSDLVLISRILEAMFKHLIRHPFIEGIKNERNHKR